MSMTSTQRCQPYNMGNMLENKTRYIKYNRLFMSYHNTCLLSLVLVYQVGLNIIFYCRISHLYFGNCGHRMCVRSIRVHAFVYN